MTQRVARPMKFAAFISIIISVAVIFAACQGAVGPKGDKGDDGDKGDKGDTTMGLPGFTPLQVKGDALFVLINDVDNDDTDDELLNDPGEAVTIDLTDHFRGGTAPFKYGSPVVEGEVASSGAVTIERVDDGPMYKFSVPAEQETGADLTTWTVTITDNDGSTLDIEIKARRNDAPEGDAAAVPAIVGTQAPDMAPATVPDCPAANECAASTVDFTDGNAEEILTFTAVSADTTKVEVVSVAPATGDADNAVVVIRGIASTWADDAMPDDDTDDAAGHIAVEITVTATDRGGETAERTLEVDVDAAPTAAEAFPSYAFTPTYTTDKITNLDEFFKDTEGELFALWVTAAGEDQNVVVTSGGAFVSVAVQADELTITRKAAGGSAVITITATEATGDGPEQTVTGVINVTTS